MELNQVLEKKGADSAILRHSGRASRKSVV